MGVSKSIGGVRDKLMLGEHHAMERFVILSAVVALFLVGTVFTAFNSARANNAITLSEQSLYMDSFTTSRTGNSGEVHGVYVNEDKSRALLFMQFSTPDQISIDANHYQSWLSGITPDLQPVTIDEGITGELVIFGSTGYMGVLLEHPTQFEPQIYNLILRNNAELVNAEPGSSSSGVNTSVSFEQFDQWQVAFNPGASTAQHITALDGLKGSGLDISKTFWELTIKEQEEEIYAELESQLVTLKRNLTAIETFENQIATVRSSDNDVLVNPRDDNASDVFAPILNDEIIGEEGTVLQEEVMDEDGDLVQNLVYTDSTLELKSSWVPEYGYELDWRNGSISEGYLDKLVPAGERYGEWLTAHVAKSAESQRFSSSSIEWKLADGRTLKDAQINTQAAIMAPLNSLSENLNKAYTEYYNNKIMYLATTPQKLLDLEVGLRGAQAMVSTNKSQEAVAILN